MGKNKTKKIKVINLFCGIGGLTHGLIKEGLDVVAGIDNDNACKFGYEYNNKARFINENILKVTADDINDLFGRKKYNTSLGRLCPLSAIFQIKFKTSYQTTIGTTW